MLDIRASSGIGKAYASRLAHDGYNIIAIGRDEDALKKPFDKCPNRLKEATNIYALICQQNKVKKGRECGKGRRSCNC